MNTSQSLHKQLSDTSKGHLQYGNLRNPSKRLHLNTQTHPFNLNSLSVCLELIEDEAHLEEHKYLNKKCDNTRVDQSTITNVIRSSSPELLCESSAVIAVAKHIAESDVKNQTKIHSKIREHEQQQKLACQNALQKFDKFKQKQKSRQRKNEYEFKVFQKSSEQRATTIKQQNIEQQENSTLKLKTKLQEAEKRKQMKLQQDKERLGNLQTFLKQSFECYKNTKLLLNNETYTQFVNDPKISTVQAPFETTYKQINQLSHHCHSKGYMEQKEWQLFSDLLAKFLYISQTLVANLEELKQRNILMEEEVKRQKQLELDVEKEKKLLLELEMQKHIKENNPEFKCPTLPKELQLCVSRSAYFYHQVLKKITTKYEEITKQLNTSKENQKLIIGLNKATSVPISSITNRSWSDIKSKLCDLNGLLREQDVKVGNQRVNVSSHPDGFDYACFLMAKKFVKQAEDQVSANHAAAFSLALAIIGVWEQNKIVGELVLGQLQSKCPFIIPLYIPRLDTQSEVEYNRLRGYICGKDGTVEAQDKYLKRMSGFIRTYAAIIQSPLPPSIKKHPHGIEEGWKWITRMLNLDPWPEVTATVLFDFLEVAGHVLMEAYSSQFKKLLYFLCHDYFPRIKEVSGNKGGPLQRLEMFLLECIKSDHVPKPRGYLGPSFWNTYHHTGVVGS